MQVSTPDGVTVFVPQGKEFGLDKGVITIKDNGLQTPSLRLDPGTEDQKESAK
jgi:hypothetical protein